MKNMRDKLWLKISVHHPVGQMLPKWLFLTKAVLHPVLFIQWLIGKNIGYQFEHGVWIINGMRINSKAFYRIHHAENLEVFKIVKNGNYVDFVKVEQ